jgi:hypothetical protein
MGTACDTVSPAVAVAAGVDASPRTAPSAALAGVSKDAARITA